MANLRLLARIAEGERTFAVGPDAPAEEQRRFDQLVCDVRQLSAAGYTGAVRAERHVDAEGQRWRALAVLSPGITQTGAAALRRAGLDVTGEFALPIGHGRYGAVEAFG